MKVGLVVISGNENLYLRDFVKYYKDLGIDNIIFGDNSQTSDNHPYQVIGDFMDSGYILYHNLRLIAQPNLQTNFYCDMFIKYKNDFDWLAFFDVDEYLTFNDINIRNIKEFLSNQKFNDEVGQIRINWKIYNDNDQLYYDNKPVMERFKNPAPLDFISYGSKFAGYNYMENSQTKLIINCKIDSLQFYRGPHIAIVNKNNKKLNIVNASGEIYNPGEIDYNVAQLNHYQTYTISEFLCKKFLHWTDPINAKPNSDEVSLGQFFACNKRTKEKEEIIKKFLNNTKLKL